MRRSLRDQAEGSMENAAQIRVSRKMEMLGGRIVRYKVIIDDVQVGALLSGEAEEFDVEPGDHRVRVMVDKNHGSDEWGVQLKEGELGKFECGPNARALTAVLDLVRRKPWIDLHPADELNPPTAPSGSGSAGIHE
jgi:hypothetical protein